MTLQCALLSTAPKNQNEWSWNPCGRNSRCNPFSYLSTKAVEAVDNLSNWGLFIFTIFTANTNNLLTEKPSEHKHRHQFEASLVGVGVAGSVKLLTMKTLNDRKSLIRDDN